MNFPFPPDTPDLLLLTYTSVGQDGREAVFVRPLSPHTLLDLENPGP